MNSLAKTKNRIKEYMQENPDYWAIPFMEFVDDFREKKNPEMIEEPFKVDDERFDALLASTVEYLCNENNMPVPKWIDKISSLKLPWFVAGMESLKAISIVESPLEFKVRNIFVLSNFLDRV